MNISNRVPLFAALIPLVSALWLTINPTDYLVVGFTEIAVFFIATLTFVLIDLFGQKASVGMWGGYLNFITLVTWLSLNLHAALIMMIGGAGIAALIRLSRSIMQGQPTDLRRVPDSLLARIAINGVALLGGALVFSVLLPQETTPLTFASAEIPILSLALITALILTAVQSWLLTSGSDIFVPSFESVRVIIMRVVNEGLLLILVPTAALLLHEVGLLSFSALIAMICLHSLPVLGKDDRPQTDTRSQVAHSEADTKELEARLRQLTIIENISRQISGFQDEDQLADHILEAAIRATRADRGVLAIRGKNDQFRIIAQEYVNGELQHAQQRPNLIEDVVQQVVQTRQYVLVPNRTRDSAQNSNGHYRSALAVPLIRDGFVIGVLDVESQESAFFNAEQVEFVQNLAGHAVISIQNTRLLQEHQQQIETLTYLRELSLHLSDETSRDVVVNHILDVALSMMHGKHALLFNCADREDAPTLESGLIQLDDQRLKMPGLPIPEFAFAHVQHSGDVYSIDDIQKDAEFQAHPDYDLIPYRGLIMAPIKHGGGVQDILCITYDNTDAAAAQRTNIELLSIQAAGHLANTSLYERLRSNTNRMAAIVDSSSDGIILLNQDGSLVMWNASAEDMLGIVLDDFRGQNFADVLLQRLKNEGESAHEAREGLTTMARILRLEPRRITRHEYTLQKHGQPIYVEEVGSPVMESNNRILGRLLVLRDRTEEKHLEQYRDEITHMAVHDLRGPLSSIISSLTLGLEIIEDPQDLPPEAALIPAMEVSLDSANNLLELVDSLLDIAKLESREMPLNMQEHRLSDMIESSIKAIGRLIDDANLELIKRIPDNLPPVYADGDKIRRVLINLLDNAVRYSPEDGQIWIEAEPTETGRRILVRIADSGKGIPPKERDRVFDKFRQISGAQPARGRKGSGLGLTFCMEVIKAHDERIWVEEDGPLSGASFAFTLPVSSTV